MFAFFAAFFSSRRLDEAMACWGGRSRPARPASRMPAFFALEESMEGLREASRGSFF